MNKKIILMTMVSIAAMLMISETVLAACSLCGTPIRLYPVRFNNPFPVQFNRPYQVRFSELFSLQNRCNSFVIKKPQATTGANIKLPSMFGCQGVCQRFVVE
jgi:hypothetical protein